MEKKYIVYTAGVALFVVTAMVLLSTHGGGRTGYENEDLKQLASCISDSGAMFYGTYWCGHCGAQKNDFGNAKQFLPYVECATPTGGAQAQACESAGITSYPTWVFENGERLAGRQSLETLAEKTGCFLPEAVQAI